MTAYERLIDDAMDGDQTLFARADAVAASWRIVDDVHRRRRPRRAGALPTRHVGTSRR